MQTPLKLKQFSFQNQIFCMYFSILHACLWYLFRIGVVFSLFQTSSSCSSLFLVYFFMFFNIREALRHCCKTSHSVLAQFRDDISKLIEWVLPWYGREGISLTARINTNAKISKTSIGELQDNIKNYSNRKYRNGELQIKLRKS